MYLLDFESDSDPEEIEDIRDRKDWDRFDQLQRDIDSIPVCGYKVSFYTFFLFYIFKIYNLDTTKWYCNN